MADKEEKSFTVKDRRRFTESGEPRDPEGTAPRGATLAAEDALRGGPSEKEPVASRGPRAIDFTTFVFSLGSSALMLMGDAPNPETGETMKNLPLARETIDVLAMLQEKTRGNLSPEEDRFLDSLIYDLRLRFVEASRE